MTHQAPYAISYTPAGGSAITLVSVGGWMAEAPVFEAEQGLFETDGVSLANAFFRPLSGVVVSVRFAIETDQANLINALDAFLDSIEGSELQTGGDLKFIPVSGALITFADAVITDITPDLPSWVTSSTTRTYQVKASIPTLS